MPIDCQDKVFPMLAGGARDEKVTCTMYDKENE